MTNATSCPEATPDDQPSGPSRPRSARAVPEGAATEKADQRLRLGSYAAPPRLPPHTRAGASFSPDGHVFPPALRARGAGHAASRRSAGCRRSRCAVPPEDEAFPARPRSAVPLSPSGGRRLRDALPAIRRRFSMRQPAHREMTIMRATRPDTQRMLAARKRRTWQRTPGVLRSRCRRLHRRRRRRSSRHPNRSASRPVHTTAPKPL